MNIKTIANLTIHKYNELSDRDKNLLVFYITSILEEIKNDSFTLTQSQIDKGEIKFDVIVAEDFAGQNIDSLSNVNKDEIEENLNVGDIVD